MGPDQTVEIMRKVLMEAMMLSAPLLATAAVVSLAVSLLQTLTSVQVTNSNPYGGALSIDLSGLTVDVAAAPVPTPQPQDCTRPGNSCNTPAADNSQAWKWQSPDPGTTVTNPNAKNTASATIRHKSH